MSDSGTYLYVSQNDAKRISVLRIATDANALVHVQDIDAGGMVMPLAVSPDRRFLYAALRDEPVFAVVSFAIDRGTGRLTRLGQVPAADSITYIATDRSGRYLFAATNPHTKDRPAVLSQNAIGEDGWVQAPFRTWVTPPKLHAVLPDPGNRFILATSCNGEAIVRYPFDAATGILGPEPLALIKMDVTSRRGPRHLVFHPNHRFLYVINEYDATVTLYRYDARDAGLEEVQVIDAKPPSYQPSDRRGRGISAGGADIHLTPDGRWLYASVRGALSMAIFAVNCETGLLASAGHFPVPAEPRGFAIDPTGRYLFVAGDASASLVMFRINSETGQCTQIGEYATGEGPNWISCVRLP